MKVIHPKMAGEGHPQLRLPSQRKAQERQKPLTEGSPKSSCQQTGRRIQRT